MGQHGSHDLNSCHAQLKIPMIAVLMHHDITIGNTILQIGRTYENARPQPYVGPTYVGPTQQRKTVVMQI